jgi:hypothetical protein
MMRGTYKDAQAAQNVECSRVGSEGKLSAQVLENTADASQRLPSTAAPLRSTPDFPQVCMGIVSSRSSRFR